MMEAEYLSNMRTGEAAVVAAKHLARPASKVVAFIDTGNLARHMFHAHVEHYGGIEQARTWSRKPAARQRFAAEMQERFGVPVEAPAGGVHHWDTVRDMIARTIRAASRFAGLS